MPSGQRAPADDPAANRALARMRARDRAHQEAELMTRLVHVHDPAPAAPMDWAEIVDLVSNYARSQGLRWDDAARELAADAQDRRDAS